MTVLNQAIDYLLPEWAKPPILVGLRGSDAHGTKIRDRVDLSVDDTDVFCITTQSKDYYASIESYLGSACKSHRLFWDSNGQELDIQVYDIRKFAHLISTGNPNCICWLWNRTADYLYSSNAMTPFFEHREMFVTKRVIKALYHYARGQQKRILADNKYEGYMGAKRKALVDKFGFDLKFAAHTFRLAMLGIEAAEAGTLWSYRPEDERATIVAIKSGHLSLDETNRLIEEPLAQLADLLKDNQLPDGVDMDVVNALVLDVINYEEEKRNKYP